jgi:hypothetical protein
MERSPDFPPEHRVCDYRNSHELTGDLGLREWVRSAFFPVEVRDLWAGNHPAPGGAKPTGPPSVVAAPKPISTGPAAGLQPTRGPTPAQFTKINDDYSSLATSLQQAQKALSDMTLAEGQIGAVFATAQRTKHNYEPVTVPSNVRKTLRDTADIAWIAFRYARGDLAKAKEAFARAKEAGDDATTQYNEFKQNAAQNIEADYQTQVDFVTRAASTVKSESENVNRLLTHAQALQKDTASLSYTPDPPVDSMLHSVQFVVSYGGSISPSWTLINWKGPALNGPAASAQGVRTNILQLALGPRTGAGQATQEQQRLINNSILLLTRP